MASTKADLRELKTNSSATVQELQEFLSQLRGKSPQEMLGVVASSQLFRATILSIILVTGTIFALTAFPYFFGEEPTPDSEPVAEAIPAAPARLLPSLIQNPPTQKNRSTWPLSASTTSSPPPEHESPRGQGRNFLKDLE